MKKISPADFGTKISLQAFGFHTLGPPPAAGGSLNQLNSAVREGPVRIIRRR